MSWFMNEFYQWDRLLKMFLQKYLLLLVLRIGLEIKITYLTQSKQ